MDDMGQDVIKCLFCQKPQPRWSRSTCRPAHGVCDSCKEEARKEHRCVYCCGSGYDLSYNHERDSRECCACGGTGDYVEEL